MQIAQIRDSRAFEPTQKLSLLTPTNIWYHCNCHWTPRSAGGPTDLPQRKTHSTYLWLNAQSSHIDYGDPSAVNMGLNTLQQIYDALDK